MGDADKDRGGETAAAAPAVDTGKIEKRVEAQVRMRGG